MDNNVENELEMSQNEFDLFIDKIKNKNKNNNLQLNEKDSKSINDEEFIQKILYLKDDANNETMNKSNKEDLIQNLIDNLEKDLNKIEPNYNINQKKLVKNLK